MSLYDILYIDECFVYDDLQDVVQEAKAEEERKRAVVLYLFKESIEEEYPEIPYSEYEQQEDAYNVK
jgi:hypothetical protein